MSISWKLILKLMVYGRDAFAEATYARTLTFDLTSVSRSLAGPSKPHKLVPTSTLRAEGIVKEDGLKRVI